MAKVFTSKTFLKYIYRVQNQPTAFILIVFCIMYCCKLQAQQSYWQQSVNYTINVSLDDEAKTLTADETIHYTNNSPDTLKFILFHLWMNAYKNDQTAY